ncbi:PH domain-containing protein [Flavobacterium sp. 3HN19-14]|uniref:PH domain-containing protein n=1 Tax=Flavobacterium sp. 3HN19-14 TaxID=3448133 RepID=UPI003EE15063
MNEQLKKFLNEEQDPKAVEKITSKLNDLLMKGEEIGYIGVQKKPVTVFPDSLVVTNKRIILCSPKNLGLSMDFNDYTWDDIESVFVKENILGSEVSFTTKTDLSISIDYIPKTQARKLYTFSKEQLDILKNGPIAEVSVAFETPTIKDEVEVAEIPAEAAEVIEAVEEMETEEVTDFAEIMPIAQPEFSSPDLAANQQAEGKVERTLAELSNEELFEKLQNYKKLLDNGLILQGEYDALKKEILSHM